MRKYGVNTEYIVRGGDRVGIYFLEKALPRDLQRLFMIVQVHRSILRIKGILTGKRYLAAQSGFISQVLLLRSMRMSPESVWMPARQRKLWG